MTTVTVPADKRFMRAHAHPSRRHARLRRVARMVRLAAIIGLGVVAVGWVAEIVMTAPVLRIERISVRGNQRLSRGEVLALVSDLRGQNIVRADLEAARRRLMGSPWVADAMLRKRLPAAIEVRITERRPMGIARLDGHLFLVDDRGRMFDEYGPEYAEFDLPIIDGLMPAGNTQIDAKRADLAARVVAALAARPDVVHRVSQIDVSDARDAVVILNDDTTLLRLGEGRFLERLESYIDLAPRLRESAPVMDYADLRYGKRIFVGQRQGG